jgi:hypothetical protein
MKRPLAVVAFAAFTLACVVWLLLLWVSINLLSFPCNSPENPDPCSEVIPWFFATRGILPTGVVWLITAWATFRKRREREED